MALLLKPVKVRSYTSNRFSPVSSRVNTASSGNVSASASVSLQNAAKSSGQTARDR